MSDNLLYRGKDCIGHGLLFVTEILENYATFTKFYPEIFYLITFAGALRFFFCPYSLAGIIVVS
jgi:hypothetical protein